MMTFAVLTSPYQRSGTITLEIIVLCAKLTGALGILFAIALKRAARFQTMLACLLIFICGPPVYV